MPYQQTKKRYFLTITFGLLFYFIYTSISDIYPILPPLVGVLFMIFHRHYNDDKFYIPMLILVCIFYFEFDKSLVVGIIPCIFFITHLFIAEQLESLLHTNVFFVLIYVSALYLFYLAGMILCNILFNTPILGFSMIYIYYIIIDCILAVLYYYPVIRESR